MKRIGLIALAVLAMAPSYSQNGYRSGQNRQPSFVPPATAQEVQSLSYMREEEKLARDVYAVLYERWKYAAFDRIAASEQQHFDAIGALLTRYAIPDPAAVDAPGVFVDPHLTALYAELTFKGLQSLKDALEVGVLVEKTDIADLAAANVSAKLDIQRVLTNLMQASFNHLDAFEAGLDLLAMNP